MLSISFQLPLSLNVSSQLFTAAMLIHFWDTDWMHDLVGVCHVVDVKIIFINN